MVSAHFRCSLAVEHFSFMCETLSANDSTTPTHTLFLEVHMMACLEGEEKGYGKIFRPFFLVEGE